MRISRAGWKSVEGESRGKARDLQRDRQAIGECGTLTRDGRHLTSHPTPPHTIPTDIHPTLPLIRSLPPDLHQLKGVIWRPTRKPPLRVHYAQDAHETRLHTLSAALIGPRTNLLPTTTAAEHQGRGRHPP